jgi:hypothetical protein
MNTMFPHALSLAFTLACTLGCGADPTIPLGGAAPGQPIPDADFAAIAMEWEESARQAADARWSADRNVPAQTRSYYDRSYAWYVLGYADRAEEIQQAYMVEYVDRIRGAAPPRHQEPDGLVERYLRTGDALLLVSLENMADHLTRLFINKGWVDCSAECSWEGRIQERALLVTMAADAMNVPNPRHDYRAAARRTKDGILSTQNADGSWTPPDDSYEIVSKPGSYVSTNFMSAAAMSALMRYAEYYGEDVPAIVAAVGKGAEWLWTTQWRTDGSFNYWSDWGAGGDGPNATSDLNMLFVDVFGWLYKQTGDEKWIARGDEIFTEGVRQRLALGSGNYHKHYNQYIRSAWRYLYFRQGYSLDHIQNPTEVHR